MGNIFIEGLLARCIIGVGEEERREKQDVLISVVLLADLRRPSITDDFRDTVDYRAIKKKILTAVEESSYHLVEALARRVADVCLESSMVTEVRVRIEKPSVLRFARTVGVEIVRVRE